jgi:hypothetical protein
VEPSRMGRRMTPELWIGIGTVFFLIGTAMVTWGTVRSTSMIASTTTAIKTATETLQTQTAALEQVNKEIADKAEQINALTQENLNQLTSADSFCYVSASVMAPGNDAIVLHLMHSGKYPIYDLAVEVHDQSASKKFWDEFHRAGRTQLTAQDWTAAMGIISVQTIGTMPPNSGRRLITVPYGGERRSFDIMMSARSSLYRETITLMKRPQGEGYALDQHLYKRGGGEDTQIWEQVSPDFVPETASKTEQLGNQ